MSRIAIVADSNSGITQQEAKELGIRVLPMPFYIDGELHFEDIDLTQEEFYEALKGNVDISTSQPSPADVMDLWNDVLKEYDFIVHIPMSSGLSSSYETAAMLAEDYDGKVFVVNNQRISVTQKQSVFDALKLVEKGSTAEEIKDYLEKTKFDSSIYIVLDTLYYLKKGGRITPAAAALGTLLKLKPVLQIQGDKLDAYAKCRTFKHAKQTMVDAVINDCIERFDSDENALGVVFGIAYAGCREEAEAFRDELKERWPDHEFVLDPLSLSVSCHIGPGAIGIGCCKRMDV